MHESKDELEKRIQNELQQEIIAVSSDGKSRPYSLILFDIDNFKAFNDMYSYTQGDEILNGVDYILKKMSESHRFIGIYGNYGGDEFIITLPVTSVDDAETLAGRLQKTVREHHFEDVSAHEDFKEIVTLTLGVSAVDLKQYISSNIGEAAKNAFDTLLNQSNVALDYGKVIGGNNVQKFHDFLDEEWRHVQNFRQIYFKGPFVRGVTKRLNVANLPDGLKKRLLEDFRYLRKRLMPTDTRILAAFADRSYREYLLTFPEGKDELISSIRQIAYHQ